MGSSLLDLMLSVDLPLYFAASLPSAPEVANGFLNRLGNDVHVVVRVLDSLTGPYLPLHPAVPDLVQLVLLAPAHVGLHLAGVVAVGDHVLQELLVQAKSVIALGTIVVSIWLTK